MRERLRRLGLRAFIGVLWAAAVYYLVFGGPYSVFDLRALEQEEVRAQRRLDSLRTVADSLELRADSLENDSFAIERTARERYGMIRDGERLIRFVRVHDRETGPDGSVGKVDEPRKKR